MIYAKAFHLSSKERSKRTIGELVNHMAIDANIFNDMTFYFYPIFTPIIVVMCVVLLWQEIGVSNLAVSFLIALYAATELISLLGHWRNHTFLPTQFLPRSTNDALTARINGN